MKRILLIPDIPNWAWDHNANGIIKNLPQYKFTKAYGRSAINENALKTFDSILIFPWYDADHRYRSKLNTAVSAHNFQYYWSGRSRKELPEFKSIAAFSNKIKTILEKNNLNSNVYYCPCGVDEELFYPRKNVTRRPKFRIGWTGKMIQETKEKFHMKGYNILLKPIMRKLSKYSDIEFVINSKGYQNAVKFEDMPTYYNNIDVQICTSFREGTPNPIFEASACGKPVISTDVGCIPELIKHGNNGFIVPTFNDEIEAEKRVDDFVNHILYLKDNKDICQLMGNENRKIIEEHWTWKNKAKNYIPIFEGDD